jgi:hypothetical protein
VNPTANEPLPFPAGRPFSILPDEPPGPSERDVTPSLIEMARAVAAICASRILLLLAVLISAPIWTYTAYEPSTLRIVAASAYSVLGVLPLVVLFYKRG